MRAVIHLVLHVLVPVTVARAFFRPRWRRAAFIMLATMAVDLDHLLADPIYSPGRCSIGYIRCIPVPQCQCTQAWRWFRKRVSSARG